MSSNPEPAECQSNEQVSKLILDAIKSLKKTGGSTSKAIHQYIRSVSSTYIDANDVEKGLEIACTEKAVRVRTVKNTGIKLYRIKTLPATKKIKKKSQGGKNKNSRRKAKRERLRQNHKKKNDSSLEESQGVVHQNGNWFCEICKVPLSSKKNLDSHKKGKKHKQKAKLKAQKKNKKSFNSARQLTEVNRNDVHSSIPPNDFLSFNPPEAQPDVLNKDKTHSNGHELFDSSKNLSNESEPFEKKNAYSEENEVPHQKKSYSGKSEESDRKKSYSRDLEEPDRKKSYSKNYDESDRKKRFSRDSEESNRKKNYSRDSEESDRKKSYSKDSEQSDRKKSYSNYSEVSDRKERFSRDYEESPRQKYHDNDYRNNYSKPILPANNYYSSNRTGHYYNNQNYSYRNNHWNSWSPNQSFRGSPNMRFQPFNRYNQNYHFNHYHNNIVPPPMFDNLSGMPYPERNNFYSVSIQSENIQPVEANENFEANSDSKKFDEIKTPTEDQKSPIKKSNKVVGKNKRSPRISIKDINKTVTNSEEVQDQPGNEKQQKDAVLSENVTGKRLAHWINPSNQKDQAEIRRLVTEFSKSRKKENLLRLKLHTDKVAVNCGVNPSAVEGTNNPESLTPEVPESENSAQTALKTVASVSSDSLADNSGQTTKRQRSSSFTDIAENSTSTVALIHSKRNRSESLSTDEKSKTPQRRYTKRKTSIPGDSPSSRKRKDSVEQGSTSKKHKCSSAECLEKCIESAILNTEGLINSERAKPHETVPVDINSTSKDASSQLEGVCIKKEFIEEMDAAQMTSLSLNELIQKQTDAIASCQDDASLTPVESLINLFATGNIAIKKEFDDPLIDAIRSIDPVLLGKVCENEPVPNVATQETSEKINEPATIPPPVIPDNSLVPINSAPSLTLSLKNIINELQLISEEEEKVKDNLQKADEQIQYYQSLLDGWKTKKIKFQSEEEILRNKRNTLVNTMNDLVAQQSSENRSTNESPATEERPPSIFSPSTNAPKDYIDLIKKEINSIEIDDTESNSSNSLQKEREEKNSAIVVSDDDVIPIENDEIVVLPQPPSRIPVIDLDHVGTSDKSHAFDIFSKKISNTESISANHHKLRDLVAHNAVVNSLQIFNDYLYTCANDKTAKRISIKDPTKVVTFSHAEKNIIHLCVERMRGKTYVFTSASNSNFITVFDAESALKVKVHQFRSNISNICKGKCKIYVGLKNGLIHTCDWKEQKELVHNEEPIRSLATAHQGGINILVTLSSKGNVSVRDVDRNGLLIKYVKALAHVPLFMSIYNDWVYLSSAGYLSVLDLSTGTFVKKYELPAAYTSLTVYKDHIFTTSFSGFVRCYSKYDIQDVKAYYGAGKLALTCILVHEDWVFTGNRTGEISVFKFDSETTLRCQFGKCSMVFARRDDLMYHVMQGKDHNLVSLKTCLWRKCNAPMKKGWDQEAIHNHVRAHITALCPSVHEPMYNLTV